MQSGHYLTSRHVPSLKEILPVGGWGYITERKKSVNGMSGDFPSTLTDRSINIRRHQLGIQTD